MHKAKLDSKNEIETTENAKLQGLRSRWQEAEAVELSEEEEEQSETPSF